MEAVKNTTYNNTTTLQKANIKYGGKYKVVVDINKKLFLDDYDGNRKEIDMTNDFLLQVSNFLQTKTTLIDYEKLNYGFFVKEKTLKFHAPMFISDNDENPAYVCIGNLSFGDVFNKIKIFDLNELGIDAIINDINFDKDFNYSVIQNINENYIELYGYDIINNCYTTKKLNSNEIQTKLTDVNDLNLYIEDLYHKNNLINPRFINFEFEFNNYSYHNFQLVKLMGFVSNSNISKNPIFDQFGTLVNIDTHTLDQKNNDTLIYHNKLIYQETITATIPTNTHLTLTFANINFEDEIKIRRISDNEIIYVYKVKKEDLKIGNLNLVLQSIAKNINLDSDFLVEHKNNTINIISNFADDLTIDVPFYVSKSSENFVNLLINDIKFATLNPVDLENAEDLVIVVDNTIYEIASKFKYFDTYYYRLNTINKNANFDGKTVYVSKRFQAEYYNMQPILHGKAELNLTYTENCNKAKYIENLLLKYPENSAEIEEFKNSILSYVEPQPYLQNNIEIKSQALVGGTNSFMQPNVFNYDENIYIENENLLYHWFLVNSEPPFYLSADSQKRFVANKLYDDDNNLTLKYIDIKSKLKTRTKNDSFCECVFLGVKYLLDYSLNGYHFAVIHMPNSNKNENITEKYKLHLNHEDKEVILLLNKFILFTDLIRGGDINNNPFIDLTLYYTVDKLYVSNKDDIQFITKRGGLLLTEEKIPVLYKGLAQNIIDNWRIYDAEDQKWYICLKNNYEVNIADLNDYLEKSGDVEFYHYNTIKDVGKIIATKYKIINIVDITKDYVWCENLEISFYEADNLYLDDGIDITKINTYIATEVENKIEIKATVNGGNDIYIIFDPTRKLDFKADYYECELNDIDNIFKFPENTEDDLIIADKLRNYKILPSNNNKYLSTKIKMFHRSQLWFLTKHLLSSHVYFKYENFSQIRKNIKDLTVEYLRLFSQLNLIKSNSDREYELIVGEKNYGLTYWNNKIAKINRLYTQYRPKFKEIDLIYYSIMCYFNDIKIDVNLNSNIFNYKTGLSEFLIEKNSQINLKDLFSKYYKLSHLEIDNKKIDYQFSKNSQDNIIVDSNYINKKITLTFIRK